MIEENDLIELAFTYISAEQGENKRDDLIQKRTFYQSFHQTK